jgi:hypothetical protein
MSIALNEHRSHRQAGRNLLPGVVGMKRSYVGLAMSALVMVAALLAFPSCGFERRLVSITINPPGATIVGPNLTVHFQALGNYIHPPDQHDITDSVVWTSAAPEVVSFLPNEPGVAQSGTACGTNITITATSYSNPQTHTGAVVVGTATVNVTPTATTPPIC